MAKTCFIDELMHENPETGDGPTLYRAVVTVIDTMRAGAGQTDSVQLLFLSQTDLSIPNMSARIRTHYGLGPLVAINWPFNAKGDLL